MLIDVGFAAKGQLLGGESDVSGQASSMVGMVVPCTNHLLISADLPYGCCLSDCEEHQGLSASFLSIYRYHETIDKLLNAFHIKPIIVSLRFISGMQHKPIRLPLPCSHVFMSHVCLLLFWSVFDLPPLRYHL